MKFVHELQTFHNNQLYAHLGGSFTPKNCQRVIVRTICVSETHRMKKLQGPEVRMLVDL